MTEREAFLAVLYNGPLLPSDAICVFSGDGKVRLDAAIGALRQGIAHWCLLSGGVDDPPHSLTAQAMADYVIERGLAPKRIVRDDESQNTHEQAEWLAALCQKRHIATVTLVASPYHMPRAYLTVLASLQALDIDDKVLVLPLPAGQARWWGSPDGLAANRLDLFGQELDKIDAYGERGHVASYADGLAYLQRWEGAE